MPIHTMALGGRMYIVIGAEQPPIKALDIFAQTGLNFISCGDL
jgi:hypothetical protein